MKELKDKIEPFKTTHDLPFEVAAWLTSNFMRFRIGTCNGLWRCTNEFYDILAIDNTKPGNGHFNDVFEWFEHSCQRDKKSLRILEVWNGRLKEHLITKRGFEIDGEDNVVKRDFRGKEPIRTIVLNRVK